jgi:hypothetical protein
MPHHDTTDITALKALAVLPGNGGTKGRTPKLASVKVGSADSVYMLATFCFDLYRRLQYVAKVARPLAEHLPPEIAREMLADNEVIDGGPGWRERAEAAEAIMLRLHEELSDDWERELERAAKGSAH